MIKPAALITALSPVFNLLALNFRIEDRNLNARDVLN